MNLKDKINIFLYVRLVFITVMIFMLIRLFSEYKKADELNVVRTTIEKLDCYGVGFSRPHFVVQYKDSSYYIRIAKSFCCKKNIGDVVDFFYDKANKKMYVKKPKFDETPVLLMLIILILFYELYRFLKK